MTTKALLLEQFSASFDTESWFVPLTRAIAGLTATEAAWIGDGENHSIWQVVNHLYFWNERYYHRFKLTPLPSIEIENAATFNGGDEAWEESVARLIALMNDWRELIATAVDEKFDSKVMETREDTWASTLGHIGLHTAYHVGQILTLRKQQGKWNPA